MNASRDKLTAHRRVPRWSGVAAIAVASITLVLPPGPSAAQEAAPRSENPKSPTPAESLWFRERIEPVLKKHCYECHSVDAKELKGGLRLDSPSAMRTGGDTGPAIVPNDVPKSLLVQALRHEGGVEMPPDREKLDGPIIADFVRWVEMGAPDPRPETDLRRTDEWPSEIRAHWAFQPIARPTPPAFSSDAASHSQMSRAQTPVDLYVLARLLERNWQLAPPASREEWMRRISFDLVGLPPDPEAIENFANDGRPDAYERVVDGLLASPHFGQRWAMHWLDVVRFAESEGYEYDRHVPDAWRFRDYVVDAFNQDKPFDRFLMEQVAGDELESRNPDCLSASIFHRLGPVRRNAGNPDIALSRNEVLTERTDIIGTAFLGLTIGCARCHNHKLEPITQRDYYRMQAYFAATDENNIPLSPPEEQQRWEAATKRIKDEMQRIQELAKQKTDDERAKLLEQVEALEDTLPPPLPTIPSTANNFSKRTAVHVLRRGVWEMKLEPVGPRPPSILVSATTGELPADVSNPRSQLAEWLTSPEQPLTGRVIVNRLWQHHFGYGIVKTSNDFGTHGDAPSHPELLDWLAQRLVVEDAWRLKPLHRTIVLSATYQQSSRSVPTADPMADPARQDPDNRLWSRFSRRRLSAEEFRDAVLLVSGRLNREAGGASIMPPVDPELIALLYKPAQWQITRDRSQHDRRSIYMIAKRNLRLPFLEAFDAPALQTSCARRESSTHAPQALELMNGEFTNGLAEAFADRLRQECGASPDAIVSRAFQLALGRPPSPQERDVACQFLQSGQLREFALAIFNLHEFAYVP